jgi:hypothetical protein
MTAFLAPDVINEFVHCAKVSNSFDILVRNFDVKAFLKRMTSSTVSSESAPI